MLIAFYARTEPKTTSQLRCPQRSSNRVVIPTTVDVAARTERLRCDAQYCHADRNVYAVTVNRSQAPRLGPQLPMKARNSLGLDLSVPAPSAIALSSELPLEIAPGETCSLPPSLASGLREMPQG